jgi:hypothetical protein
LSHHVVFLSELVHAQTIYIIFHSTSFNLTKDLQLTMTTRSSS